MKLVIACFAYYNPKLFAYCKQHVTKLHQDDPTLKRNFNNSVYTGATFNLGPQAFCFGHFDGHNSVKVRCAITSMGSYDYRLGGHIVLEDFKIVIDFPPGWTCLLPSAVVRHGNTPVQPGETRYSFTQWISGSLFRWVRHGYQLAKDLDPQDRERLDGSAEDRLLETISLFTVHGQYERDRALADRLVF